MRQDQVEERRHALARLAELAHGPALLGAGVDVREVELALLGVERGEEVEDLVQDLVRALLGLVDLVDDDDRPQAQAERLAEHELGLRHRPLGRVDEEQAAVDHREDALDLAAEVGVAGRVDDVDPRALPGHRGALGEDGDPALALDVVAVQRPFLDVLVVAKGARLLQQPVDQGRLAVIDMRDDRDVPQVHGMSGREARRVAPDISENRRRFKVQRYRLWTQPARTVAHNGREGRQTLKREIPHRHPSRLGPASWPLPRRTSPAQSCVRGLPFWSW